MEPELPDGDVILIKQSTNIEDGQTYVIKKYIATKPIFDLFQ